MNHSPTHSNSPPNIFPSPTASRRIFASMYSKEPSTVAGLGVGMFELGDTVKCDSQFEFTRQQDFVVGPIEAQVFAGVLALAASFALDALPRMGTAREW